MKQEKAELCLFCKIFATRRIRTSDLKIKSLMPFPLGRWHLTIAEH